MKIAYIGLKGPHLNSGVDRVVRALSKHFSVNHQITLYCSQSHTPATTSIPGVQIIRLPGLGGKHFHMTLVYLLAGCHAILRGNYDLIHLHTIETSFLLPILKIRYRVAVTAHGRFRRLNRWGRTALKILQAMEYLFVYLSDARSSVSQQDASDLSNRFRRTVSYIPNGVNAHLEIDLEGARALLTRHNITTGNFILFAAGRLIPLKGLEVLLHAWRGYPDNTNRLVILSDFTENNPYHRTIREMADGRVHFLPLVTRPDQLNGMMQLCRFFIFPSIYEAMSMTLLDAAALGAPLVCSDSAANLAVLPKSAALFFQNGDAQSLRQALLWANSHPQEMRYMAQSASQWVHKHFPWERAEREYEKLYQSALS